MGAQLVGLVLANHAGLNHRAFRLLVRMAHTALDNQNASGRPADLYFGGWELLASTLGLEVPRPCGSTGCRCIRCSAGGRCDRKRCKCAACQRRDDSQELVRRGVQQLVAAGLVERLEDAHRGQRQVFQLHLISPHVPVPLSPTESPDVTVPLDPDVTWGLSATKPPRSGGESPDATGGPRNTEEPGTSELPQDTHPPLVPNHLAAGSPSCGHKRTNDGECVSGCGRPA